MAWASGGLEHSNGAGNLVLAQHPNAQIMAAKGNKVVSGCAVTEQGVPDLTVEVAAGTVIANGIVVAVSAVDPYSGTPVTFATSQAALTSGQAQFVMIHVDSSGVITNTEGTAAAAGQQLPPDVPEDETILAQITLTEGDSTIDTVDIEDWRQFTADGSALGDNAKHWFGTDGDYSIEFNSSTNSLLFRKGSDTLFESINTTIALKLIDDRNIVLGSGSDFLISHNVANYTNAAHINQNFLDQTVNLNLLTSNSIKILDKDDGDGDTTAFATLFDLDTTARTLAIGASADNIATEIIGTLELSGGGSGIAADIIRDEDDFAANDPLALITQQSAKTYIDNVALQGHSYSMLYLFDHITQDAGSWSMGSTDEFMQTTDALSNVCTLRLPSFPKNAVSISIRYSWDGNSSPNAVLDDGALELQSMVDGGTWSGAGSDVASLTIDDASARTLTFTITPVSNAHYRLFLTFEVITNTAQVRIWAITVNHH